MKKKFDEMTLDEKKDVLKNFISSGDEEFIKEITEVALVQRIMKGIKEYWV